MHEDKIERKNSCQTRRSETKNCSGNALVRQKEEKKTFEKERASKTGIPEENYETDTTNTQRSVYFQFSLGNLVAALILVPLAIAFTITPFLVPEGQAYDLTSRDYILDDHGDISQIDGFPGFIYSMGNVMCHQRHDRSWVVHGNQMPLCARCMSIYWGFAFFALLFSFVRLPLRWWFIPAGILPMALDGTIQLFQRYTGYESTNTLRFITGFLAGGACAVAIAFAVFMLEDERKEKEASQD